MIDGQGQEDTTDEAKKIAWLTVEEATQQMPEARAIRVTDALADSPGPAVRQHDGTHLL
jgi:hypothetical protein